MNDQERAQVAHRAAFALITSALTDPHGCDIAGQIRQATTEHDDDVRALMDLAQVLVWHAAGAVLTHTGTTEQALALVQHAALRQELSGGTP